MASFKITGGQKLHGSIQPQGAKNEVLQILCATLLTEETVRVSNIPDIVDVNQLIDILKDFGVVVTKHGHGDYSFCAKNVNSDFLFSETYRVKGASLRGS